MTKKESAEEIISSIIELKQKMDKIVSGGFRNSQSLHYAEKEGFEKFLNERPNEAAQYLAKYIDLHLNRSINHMAKINKQIKQSNIGSASPSPYSQKSPPSALSQDESIGEGKISSSSAFDAHLEMVVSQVMPIFRYIHAKDIFETFYAKRLAKRLLLNRSVSYDAEINLLNKLRAGL